MTRGTIGFAIPLLILLCPFSTESVLADAGHGNAAPPGGGISLVTFENFHVELLTLPNPPRVGEKNKIVAKILRIGSLEPVRDGKVSIGIFPANSVHVPGLNKPAVPTNSGKDPFSLSPAPELVWAGNYTLESSLDQKGLHLVRVALQELDGKIFNPPALLEFRLNIAPAWGFNPGNEEGQPHGKEDSGFRRRGHSRGLSQNLGPTGCR